MVLLCYSWATKKIFLLFLRMNSNSHINDISLTRYDIRLAPHDILAMQVWYNIRSIICRRHISSLAERYHIEDISPVPVGTDIIEKRQVSKEKSEKWRVNSEKVKIDKSLSKLVDFWWERVDSNHRSQRQQIYSLPPLATRERSHMKLKCWSW